MHTYTDTCLDSCAYILDLASTNFLIKYLSKILTLEDFSYNVLRFCKLHLSSAGPYFQLQSDVRSILLTTYEEKKLKRGALDVFN